MGRKFTLNEQDSHRDDVLESLYKLRIRESDKLRTVLELTVQTRGSSEDIEASLSEVENHGEENHRSKDQVTELSSQKREERDRSSAK